MFHNRGIHWLFLYYGNLISGNFSLTDVHQNNNANVIPPTVTIASLDCFPVIPLIHVKSLDHLGPVVGQPGDVAGHWSSSHGLKVVSSIFNKSEIHDLKGAVLNVTAVVRNFLSKL
jgi:hypothetical protein